MKARQEKENVDHHENCIYKSGINPHCSYHLADKDIFKKKTFNKTGRRINERLI